MGRMGKWLKLAIVCALCVGFAYVVAVLIEPLL
jgi:hypothetical protein